MFTGLAAQPRSGTAPNAPAAIAAPAFWRNLRRLCRFDSIGFAQFSERTERWRAFFMLFSPRAAGFLPPCVHVAGIVTLSKLFTTSFSILS
jgi:hypothetical protein